MTTYVIYPDKSIKEFDSWPEDKKDLPEGCYVYEPGDINIPWAYILNHWGSVEAISFNVLPAYCKAFALILPTD
jgi:hypothetical protein